MRLLSKIMCVVAVITASLAAACGGGGTKNAIRGLVLVTQPDQPWHVAEACTTAGDFGDIKKGTQVRVTDASGKQVAKGSLEDGRGEEDDNTDADGSETHICEFAFGIASVATTDSYTVTVGGRADASVTRSLDEMRSIFWQLTFEFPKPEPAP
ncbi:MAG: hypothetical protein M3P30_13815 [Chloroflexota bacterium]|nr:hypothetical protein [Chloroflexota bacterium]